MPQHQQASTRGPLTIESCESRQRRADIEALFLRNGYTRFPQAFEQTYQSAVYERCQSWVALDSMGRVVGHVAALPRVFRGCGVETTAALSVDLLFDPERRNFLNAARLLRRMVEDIRADGRFRFVFSDPTKPAEGVIRAAGFRRVGQMKGFVLPLVWPYRALFGLRERGRLQVEVDSRSAPESVAPLTSEGHFAAARSAALYATRLGSTTIPTWEWYVVTVDRSGGAMAGVVLARAERERRVLHVLDICWAGQLASAGSVLHGVARVAAARGYRWMAVSAYAPSAFAKMLVRCGFLPRGGGLPIFLIETGRSENVLPAFDRWLLTGFDGSAW